MMDLSGKRTPVKEISADELLDRYVTHITDYVQYGIKAGESPVWTDWERNALCCAADQLPILRKEIIRRMEESLWTRP